MPVSVAHNLPHWTSIEELIEPYAYAYTFEDSSHRYTWLEGPITRVDAIVKGAPIASYAEMRRHLYDQHEKALGALEMAGWHHIEAPQFEITGRAVWSYGKRWPEFHHEGRMRLVMGRERS